MSSRALRRAQKELEEKRQLEQLRQSEVEDDEDDEEEESHLASKSAFSAFAALNEDDEGEAEDDGDDDVVNVNAESAKAVGSSTQPTPSMSSKRKKKRKKPKDPVDTSTVMAAKADQQLDEIDSILRQLSREEPNQSASQLKNPQDQANDVVSKVLSIDTQHLHASNEMRRLFGRAAMDDDHAQDDVGRRRVRGQGQAGIGAAVNGRRGTGGQLAKLARRRNPFIQGKEEWPQAISGGLGMEVLSKDVNGVTTYTYVHSRAYQELQREFQQCVEMGDPQQMVNHLRRNSYHVSTLLQVSDIAKNMERDHATAGDLLERALFALGRSVHSTFARALAQGKARLDFRRQENRELWLAAWRYIDNLSMRGTWRTVFEWARMLLSLDPEQDPYCMRLVIDQYAIRARQPNHFKELFERVLKPNCCDHTLPHLGFTYGLALVQAPNIDRSLDSKNGREALKEAIERAPWIAARLFQELNLEPIPPAVWGKQPPTEYDNLLSELYAIRAKDVWNTPEATSLLMSVSHTVSKEATAAAKPAEGDITPDMARHVILSDKRELLSLVPRSFTTRSTSSSDPLPPDDAITTYSTTPAQSRDIANIEINDDMTAEMERLTADLEALGVNGLLGGELDNNDAAPAPDIGNRAEEDVVTRQARLQRVTQSINDFLSGGGNGDVLLNLLRAYRREEIAGTQQQDSENDDLPDLVDVSDEDEANQRRARVEDAEDEGH